MMLPLHYKASQKWPIGISSRALRRHSIVYGTLTISVTTMICTALFIGIRSGLESSASLSKRGLDNREMLFDQVELDLNSGPSQQSNEDQPAMTTTTANVGTLESPVDLLGGLTGVMPHFYVDRTESAATQITTVPAVDPFTALSDAIRKAIVSAESSRKEANVHETDLEARNNQDIQDSIVWMGQPTLFSILSDIVVQVCVVDSGAGARLIDAILSVLPVDSMDITSVMPTVAEYSSVSVEDILPLILPAIAAAIGKQVQPSRIANTQNTDGIMANIILRGGLFVGEIINSIVFLASTELYEVLNQVAGLMCTAADRLTLPICTLSKQISGTTYQIVIPCNCTGSPLPSQPPQGYIPKEKTSAVDWSVLTIFPTAGYTFSSLLPTNLPPRYGENLPESTKDITTGNLPAQSNLPYGQPQTSCTTTLPPAYSSALESASEAVYTEPDTASQTAACPVCSCPCDTAPAYSSGPAGNCPIATSEAIPSNFDGEETIFIKTPLPTTDCYTGQSPEPTATVDPMPNYSKQNEQSSQGPSSYNKQNSIPEAMPYYWDPRGWKYLGCFSDTAERVIRGGPKGFSGEDMSNEKCMDYCKLNGFTTAGTEDGRECWCGNSIIENVQLLPATACSTACQGDTSAHCGGTWAISIYSSEGHEWFKPKLTLADLLAKK